jgi:hypothetical protein
MILQFLLDVFSKVYVGIDVGLTIPDRNGLTLNDMLERAAVDIPNFSECNQNLLNRNSGKYHITVFSVMEYSQHKVDPDIIGSNYDNTKFEYKGIGSISKGDMTTYFVVVDSDAINAVRVDAGYPVKELHVTIGFTHKDLFHEPKSVTNVFEVKKTLF